ncbi:heterokaryon incompatibility protein-domain-containing protein [Chaetomium sp. MPI-SDFR-AT-0129]|nr:heterokaryon incompatibility protein-domain-containing protein [Chaetomium sp. MPI-SDFR-AT-0129]
MSPLQPPAIPGPPPFTNDGPPADDSSGLKNRISPDPGRIVINPGCLRCTALLAYTASILPHDLDHINIGHWLSLDFVPAICYCSDQNALALGCAKCLEDKKVEVWVPQSLLPYACRLWEAGFLINTLHAHLSEGPAKSGTSKRSNPQQTGCGAAVGHFRLCADAWLSAYSLFKHCVLQDDPLSAEASRIQEWGFNQVHALNSLEAHPLLVTPGALPAATGVLRGPNIELLRLWHQDYVAVDGNSLDEDSDVILALVFDELDHDAIERQVQQLMSVADVARGFCGKCRHLLEHLPDLSTGDGGHTFERALDSKEIEAATRNGCKFCAFLLSRLRVKGQLDILRKLEARLRTLGDTGTASLSMERWVRKDSLLLWVDFPGKKGGRCNYPGVIKFESHVISSIKQLWREKLDSFDLAKVWIGQCSTSHERCSSGKKYPRPTRLISIDDESIKLVLTDQQGWEITPRYATLSYCWGKGQFTKLTPENLHSFLNDIPLERLPKTFQDAIYITRKLDLRYLWIDALCIIQDPSTNADWVHEAALMRSVYGGSHVNLAASGAMSVYDGCFLKPEHDSAGFCASVTFTTTSTSDYSVVCNFHALEVYEESTSWTYLAGRAWALQERLLAPRTLFFGEQGLFWECRTEIASEFSPDGFPGKLGSHLVRPENEAWPWGQIVRCYSDAALTFETDRLPALSGIATRQRDVTGDDYLAGMWQRELVLQLPWGVRYPRNRRKRPVNWRAPSWSWISIDVPTSYWDHWDHPLSQQLKKYIYVLEAWTTLAGPDPCGQVDGGELSIGCSALIHGRVQRQEGYCVNSSTPLLLLETGTLPVPISIDCLDDESLILNDEMVYLLPVFSGKSSYSRTRSRIDGEGKVGTEFFDELINRGLILQRCGDRKGHFRRIGAFSFSHDPFPDENLEAEKNRYYHELMAVIDKVGAVTAEAEAAKVVSNPELPEARYVMTIE